MSSDGKKAIDFDARSFVIRGERKILVGGEFHYFRTPAALWEDRLIKMKASGANLVTTYIPWNWHEPEEGKQLWTGDRDLGRLLELCTKHEFFIIVKPGPYCCAELDFGGHPDWLIGKDIKLRELDECYLAYVDAWYKKIAEVIRPYLVTQGGNVVCIQVENEYDHLINYGENEITLEDALTYFGKLKGMMEKYGIDIPKFANEAEFLRGKGIIDTRTYYTNIPSFQDWMWNFKHFDEKIMKAKEGQPNCPTMILELQVGWFSMFGHPDYVPGLDLTEAVSKSVLMEGASVLNYYMYAGGTTFPFWGCRGDVDGVSLRDNDHYAGSHWDGQYHYELAAKGIGITSSFDFGGAPVREWGELMPDRYYWLKAFNRFTQDFAGLLLESDNTDAVVLLGGGSELRVIGAGGAANDEAYAHYDVSKVDLITKKRGEETLICVRNLSDEPHTVDIGWKKTGVRVFSGVALQPREVLILPVCVKVAGSGVTLLSSTSELLFNRQPGGAVQLGLYGRKHRSGEAVFDVPADQVRVVSGDVEVASDGKHTVLRYRHEGVQAVQVGDVTVYLVELDLAGKIEWAADGRLIAADAYSVKSIQGGKDGVELTVDARLDAVNAFTVLGGACASVSVQGREVKSVSDAASGRTSFEFPTDDSGRTKLCWQCDWKVQGDAAERLPDYDDGHWQVLDKLDSLENLGLFGHGYFWYRGSFDVPEGLTDAKLFYTGNDTDRQYIYINGNLVWAGIAETVKANLKGALKTGKNSVAILYQNFYHNKSHPHEGAIIKHSGVMKPLEIKGTLDGRASVITVNQLAIRQDLTGVRAGYAAAEFDDSDWIKVEQGDKYLLDDSIGELLWMRRSFTMASGPGVQCAVKLTIPKAERRCFIYVNGQAVGWYESIGPQQDFYLPESLLKEENVLTVLVDGHHGFLTEPVLGTFYETVEMNVLLKN